MPEGHNFTDYCDTEALALADLTRPVVFQTPKGNCEKKIEPSGDLMSQIMQETGDPEMAYAAMVSYAELGGE